MNSLTIMKQVFSNPAHGWFELALVAAVLIALVFRPEQIRRRSMFGLACVFLTLSIVAPSTMVMFLDEMPGLGALETIDIAVSVIVLMVAGPILFGVSFLMIVCSLMPKRKVA